MVCALGWLQGCPYFQVEMFGESELARLMSHQNMLIPQPYTRLLRSQIHCIQQIVFNSMSGMNVCIRLQQECLCACVPPMSYTVSPRAYRIKRQAGALAGIPSP